MFHVCTSDTLWCTSFSLKHVGHRNGNSNFVAETRGLWVLRSGKLKKYAGDEASGNALRMGCCWHQGRIRSEVRISQDQTDYVLWRKTKSVDQTGKQTAPCFLHHNLNLNPIKVFELFLFVFQSMCLDTPLSCANHEEHTKFCTAHNYGSRFLV